MSHSVSDFNFRESRNCTNVLLTQEEAACFLEVNEEIAPNMRASHVSLTRRLSAAKASVINLESSASLSDSV
jgi:hypothetical protein